MKVVMRLMAGGGWAMRCTLRERLAMDNSYVRHGITLKAKKCYRIARKNSTRTCIKHVPYGHRNHWNHEQHEATERGKTRK